MVRLLSILIVVLLAMSLFLQARRANQATSTPTPPTPPTPPPPTPPPPTECPEITQIKSLISFFRETQAWPVLVDVGDIYARGCFPFYGKDPVTSCNLYQLASRCPDRVVAARAMSRFADARLHPISALDSAGQPFPSGLAKELMRHAEYYVERCPPTVKRAPVQPRAPTETPSEARTEAPTETPTDRPTETRTEARATDKQNVHDHGVAQATKRNVRDIVLEEEKNQFDRVELVDSVMLHLRKTNLNKNTLAEAFRVIVSLVPDKIESIGCSQLDVLNATKKTIEGVKDLRLRKNLFERLGHNLASGVERGHVVCSTGKVARIVSTLEGTGILKSKAVPLDVLRREIETLGSKIRGDVLEEAPSSEAEAYNTSPFSPLSLEMKNRFESEVQAVYVHGLGLSPKVLDPIVALYAKEF